MITPTNVVQSPLSSLQSAASNLQQLEELLKPRTFHSHSVKVSPIAEARIKEACQICQNRFLVNAPINQFSCGHIVHSDCLISMLQSSNGNATCGLRCDPSTVAGKSFTLASIKNSIDRWCTNKCCFYKTPLDKNPDSNTACYTNIPACPYPGSLFAEGETAEGFLHKYGKVLCTMIKNALLLQGIEFEGMVITGLPEFAKQQLAREFKCNTDLKCIVGITQTIDRAINQAITSASSIKTNNKNLQKKIEKVTGTLKKRQPVINLNDSLQELRSLMIDASKHSGFNRSAWRFISKSVEHQELEPGLSSIAEQEIVVTLTFKMPEGQKLTIDLNSRILNNKNNTATQSMCGVIKIIEYAPFELRMSQLYGSMFDNSCKIFLKRPFEYIEDKINIGCANPDAFYSKSITLSKVVNDQLDDFDHEALKQEMAALQLRYEELGANAQ